MKRLIALTLGGVLGIGVILSISARKVRAAGPTYTTIDCPGFPLTLPTDINDSGQIVGQCLVSLGIRQGFLLDKGAFTPIIYGRYLHPRSCDQPLWRHCGRPSGRG